MLNLINEDCLNVLPTMPENSIDLILVDPPYGTTACKWDSVIPLDVLWPMLWRVAKPNAAVIFMAAQPFTTRLINSNDIDFKYTWVWEKNLKSGFFNANKMPMRGHEDIIIFYRAPPIYNPQKTPRGDRKRGSSTKNTKTTVYGLSNKDSAFQDNQTDFIHPDTIIRNIKCVHNGSGRLHPTQKPVELMEYLIKTYSNGGETVLDFAMGSGSTGVAALNLDRSFVGIEKDLEYFKISQDRVEIK